MVNDKTQNRLKLDRQDYRHAVISGKQRIDSNLQTRKAF